MATRTQFIDIAALFKRQEKKARKWALEWFPLLPDSKAKDLDRMRQYVSGGEPSIELSLSFITTMYEVELAVHAAMQGQASSDLLALLARYGLSHALVGATQVAANDKGAEGPIGSEFALTLSTLLIADWRDPLSLLMQAIREGLDSAYVNWSGILSLYAHFKFLTLLVADGLGQPLDRSRYGFTAKDRKDLPSAAATYEAVLADWRSTDLGVVQRLVIQMADFHVSSSAKDMLPFATTSKFLFPYEILAFLRLREWAGLPNPTSFEHPLMHTPLAVLPPAPLPWPEVPLLDQAIARFKTEYPEHNYFDRLVVPH